MDVSETSYRRGAIELDTVGHWKSGFIGNYSGDDESATKDGLFRVIGRCHFYRLP